MADKKSVPDNDDSTADEKSSLVESIKLLNLFDEEQTDKMGGAFSTYNFSLASYKKLVEQVGLPHLSFAQASELVGFLRYFQENLGGTVKDNKNFEAAFIDFLKFHEVDDVEAKDLSEEFYRKLWRIYNSKLENLDWHRSGLIDVLLDFDGFVDLRPVFYESMIVDLLPVVIFRAALQKDFENPRNVVFQMSVEEFGELKTKIDDVQEKLKGIEDKLENGDLLNLLSK